MDQASALVLCVLVAALAAAALLGVAPASAGKSFTTLYEFTGGSDGAKPRSALLVDKTGNLYGTTFNGGDDTLCFQDGCGVAFKLAPDGTETVLHTFLGPKSHDGRYPLAPLIMNGKGDLYGTTEEGGGYHTCSGDDCGTVFKLAPDGTETLVYGFGGVANDGASPTAGLVKDHAGNLYGTTAYGGIQACVFASCGTVYKIARDGSESVLYAFTGGADGGIPGYGTLVLDDAGNLYGTTVNSGDLNCGSLGCGVVFKLAPSGQETVLHTFEGNDDGANPNGGVIFDAEGNLYGTTPYGGTGTSCDGGCGIVFKIASDGTYTILHTFVGGTDGGNPYGGLVMSKTGHLYGTTASGGSAGRGTVFRLAPDGRMKVLHAFTGGDDGQGPEAPLIKGPDGSLYGTTYYGGNQAANCPSGCGTVFKLQ